MSLYINEEKASPFYEKENDNYYCVDKSYVKGFKGVLHSDKGEANDIFEAQKSVQNSKEDV